MSHHALIACYPSQSAIVDGADFDGTNDYMTRGAGLTGAADSKSGIVSFWLRWDVDLGVSESIIRNATSVGGATSLFRVTLDTSADGKFLIEGKNAASTTILSVKSNTAITPSATWLHILSSWDLAAAAAHFYVNDVSDIAAAPTLTNDDIDHTVNDFSVGALASGVGTSMLSGCLSEIYFAPGQYLDFSVEANRRKFISATGKPVSLGITGATPTGTAPLVYLHLANNEVVANFATNRGTGGHFAITGTLDTSSSSPSD